MATILIPQISSTIAISRAVYSSLATLEVGIPMSSYEQTTSKHSLARKVSLNCDGDDANVMKRSTT